MAAHDGDAGRAAQERPPVGIIGLGAMGSAMARRLLDSGVQVVAHDKSSEALSHIASHGAVAVQSPAAVGAGADVVLVVVVDASQTEQVVFGPDGLSSTMRPGSRIAVLSTIGPAAVREIARRAADFELEIIDAPVSGGVVRARNGELLIMVGASPSAFGGAEWVLRLLGNQVVRYSEKVGDGQEVKLINQLLCGVHIAAAGEAMALAKAIGHDPARVLATIERGAAASFMLSDRGPRMLSTDPEVRSATDIFVKDLDLVLEVSSAKGFDAPTAAAASGLFHTARARGLGRQDDSQVVHVFTNEDGASRHAPSAASIDEE